MIRLYIKQAWALLRENTLVSSLSIAGTALSVAAIMLLVLVYQVWYADYPPESNRFRTLYMQGMKATLKSGGQNQGGIGYRVIKECLYPLKTPEAVTAVSASGRNPLNLPGEKLTKSYSVTYTDTGFWRLFDFTFLQGAAFTQADFDAGLHRAVITESAARRLFGTTEAVGRVFQRMYVDYTVCGVVRDVSAAASVAYSEIWMPYTVREDLMNDADMYEKTVGRFAVYLLARHTTDIPQIRQELEQAVGRFNTTLAETTISFGNAPLTQWERILGGSTYTSPKLAEFIGGRGALVLFLLLLPALNIIGLTLTQFRKRRPEIGVRKAFGARASSLVTQVVTENMLYSLIGGVLGLLLSYALLTLCKPYLLGGAELNVTMLLRLGTILTAIFFTFLMNLLSVGLPALRAARMPVVKALNDMD